MDSINRPTSRVLAAPGGNSSNIFGTGPEPNSIPGKRQAANRNASNIFGAPEPETKKVEKIPEKPQEEENEKVPEKKSSTKPVENTEPEPVSVWL